jgi:hypothetical protein
MEKSLSAKVGTAIHYEQNPQILSFYELKIFGRHLGRYSS